MSHIYFAVFVLAALVWGLMLKIWNSISNSICSLSIVELVLIGAAIMVGGGAY